MKLEKMQISSEIKNAITAPIPEYLIQERQGGGGKMLSYLSGSTIVDMLNNAFGYLWSWETTREWIEGCIPFFNVYSKLPDSEKVINPATGKKGAWEEQQPVAHVKGVLTVYLIAENGQVIPVKKEGYGSKSILGKQNDQESIFKAAGTDALKKAASLFGIGLELYRNEDEQAYFEEINYVDPWTDELREQHAESLSYLKGYTETYQVNDEDFANYVLSITGDSYVVTPDNIELVVSAIKAAIENPDE